MNIVSTRYGKMRIIGSDRVVSRSLSIYGEWAEDEMALLRQIVTPGAYVLDVGAFIGTHTVAFSKFVGSEGHVYAFEPRREIYAVLSENIALNECGNTTAFNMGLGRSLRSIGLASVDLNGANNFGALPLTSSPPDDASYEVRISTVDELGLDQIDVIKIDVEGMEKEVLDGAVRSIAKSQPSIFCECNSMEAGAALLAFCDQHGYEAYAFLASAFNENNFNRVVENFFGDAKELTLLLVPRHQRARDIGGFDAGRLCSVRSIEDLVLPLLHKPQYAYEVLEKTSTSAALGIEFPSPIVGRYMAVIESLNTERATFEETVQALHGEIARVKRSFSWKVTSPLRFFSSGLKWLARGSVRR